MATGGGGLGVLGYIGLGRESSGGVAVPPTAYIQALSEGVSGDFDRYTPFAIIGALAPPDDRAGVMRVAGDITAPVNPRTHGHVFRNTFGDPVSTPSGAQFLHTWKTPTNAQAIWDDRYAAPPYTWEVFRDVGSAQQYDGSNVGGLEFTIAPNNILQCKATLIATAWRNIAPSVASYHVDVPLLDFDTASLSLGNVANTEIESLTITFDNVLEGIATLWGRDVVRKIRRTGPPVVTFQMQLGFENITILEQFRQQSETNLDLYCKQPGAGTEAFHLALPRINYTAFPTGMGDGGRQMITVTGQGRYHQGSVTAFGLQLLNSQGSYYMEELPDTAVMVDGRLIDIAPVLPLKMGSWKALRKLGVDPIAMGQKINRGTGEMDGGTLEKMVYWVLAKVDPELTEAYLDEHLELPQMIKLGGAIMSQEARKTKEGPTSTLSSPSPNGGTGDLPTLTN